MPDLEIASTEEVLTPEVEAAEAADKDAVENADSSAELDEARSYTKEEFDALLSTAVDAAIEPKIQSRVNREIDKTKAAESALAAKLVELQSLTEASGSLTEALSKAEKSALRFKIAYETKLPQDLLAILPGETEEELRLNAATFVKHAPAKSSNDYNGLFDGGVKDFTKPKSSDDDFRNEYKKY